MNRRTTLFLVGITLAGLPALTQAGFAQSDPFLGIWQLNVAKSKYPRPPPKELWPNLGDAVRDQAATVLA